MIGTIAEFCDSSRGGGSYDRDGVGEAATDLMRNDEPSMPEPASAIGAEPDIPPPPPRGRRDRLLSAWAHVVTSRPLLTLLTCVALAAAAVALTATRLEFRSDRSELVDPSLPWQKRFNEVRRNFPVWDEPAVVVVELGATPASQAAGERFIQSLSERLAADPRFPRVMSGFPREDAPPGMIFSQSIEDIRAVVGDLRQATPVLASPTLEGLLSLSQFSQRTLAPQEITGLTLLLERAASVGEGPGRTLLGLDPPGAVQRLVTRSGRYAMVLVSLSHVSSRAKAVRAADSTSDGAMDTAGDAISALRNHIRTLKGQAALSDVRTGVTGIPVLESDETALSMRDAATAGVVSLAGITLLLLIAYRGFAVPLLAVISLLIGMAWAFAWATLAVGHLQLLSITFASLLLGLGIDVAIHIIARLELVHPDHDHLAPAVAQAFRGVGPGIITASVTVAAAAGAMALTDFSGVAEMGLIAAGGIILCTISIMSVFPAMLMLIRSPERRLRSHSGGEARPFMGALGAAFHRRPVSLLLGVTVAMVIAGFMAKDIRYDTDLLRLLPASTESVRWQNALEQDDARSVWHAVVQCSSLEEAREVTQRLRSLDVVSDVEGAGILFPEEDAVRLAQQELATLPDPAAAPAAATIAEGSESPTRVIALRRVVSALGAQHSSTAPALAAAANKLAALPDQALIEVLNLYRSERARLLDQVAALRAAAPPSLGSLPAPLRELMVGADGSILLRVYPDHMDSAASVLAPERLNAFASAVLATAPNATGPSIQIYESTRLINRAYLNAALFALIAIVVLLLLDFGLTIRGVGDTFCALVPVVGGATLLLAAMRAADVDLNFANMIVMPLLVGIGVGSGVHVVRRWRLQPHDEPPGLAGGSGRAITLTTMTTMIGFAAMMLAQHRGIRSLGFTMTVGLFMVWLVMIVALPAILKLRQRPKAVI